MLICMYMYLYTHMCVFILGIYFSVMLYLFTSIFVLLYLYCPSGKGRTGTPGERPPRLKPNGPDWQTEPGKPTANDKRAAPKRRRPRAEGRREHQPQGASERQRWLNPRTKVPGTHDEWTKWERITKGRSKVVAQAFSPTLSVHFKSILQLLSRTRPPQQQ